MGIRESLREFADEEKAKVLQGFFKTGKGEYGEGDVFIGVSVPNIRRVVKEFWEGVDFDFVEDLLLSEVHEERLTGALILVEKFGEDEKKVFDFYLKNASRMNNWDLVDLTAPKIVGAYLLSKGKKVLYDLVKSEDLWERRIAIVSTFAFIRAEEFNDTLKISKMLLGDKHDLIRKAVGWMLREVGKRDVETLRKFLRENYSSLSRTTLRYAIERFGEEERLRWLRG